MAEIIYAKYNKLRGKQYRLSTFVYQDGDERWVEKQPLCPEAEAHVKQFVNRSEQLEKEYPYLDFVKASPAEKGVRFEYVVGATLDNLLAQKITSAAEMKKGFVDIFKYILPDEKQWKPLQITPEFQRVFGEGTGLEGLPSAPFANVDCNLDNFVVRGQKIVCLDYEWVFDFDVPIDFMRYRVVHYFYDAHPEAGHLIDRSELLREFGLSSLDCALYQAMEQEFQRYVYGGEVDCRYTANYRQAVTDYETMEQVQAQKDREIEELRKVVGHYQQVEGKLRKIGLWQTLQAAQKAGRAVKKIVKK